MQPPIFADLSFRGKQAILAEKKGGRIMRETDDPNADLEDLIFDEDMGGPSER